MIDLSGIPPLPELLDTAEKAQVLLALLYGNGGSLTSDELDRDYPIALAQVEEWALGAALLKLVMDGQLALKIENGELVMIFDPARVPGPERSLAAIKKAQAKKERGH